MAARLSMAGRTRDDRSSVGALAGKTGAVKNLIGRQRGLAVSGRIELFGRTGGTDSEEHGGNHGEEE